MDFASKASEAKAAAAAAAANESTGDQLKWLHWAKAYTIAHGAVMAGHEADRAIEEGRKLILNKYAVEWVDEARKVAGLPSLAPTLVPLHRKAPPARSVPVPVPIHVPAPLARSAPAPVPIHVPAPLARSVPVPVPIHVPAPVAAQQAVPAPWPVLFKTCKFNDQSFAFFPNRVAPGATDPKEMLCFGQGHFGSMRLESAAWRSASPRAESDLRDALAQHGCISLAPIQRPSHHHDAARMDLLTAPTTK